MKHDLGWEIKQAIKIVCFVLSSSKLSVVILQPCEKYLSGAVTSVLCCHIFQVSERTYTAR